MPPAPQPAASSARSNRVSSSGGFSHENNENNAIREGREDENKFNKKCRKKRKKRSKEKREEKKEERREREIGFLSGLYFFFFFFFFFFFLKKKCKLGKEPLPLQPFLLCQFISLTQDQLQRVEFLLHHHHHHHHHLLLLLLLLLDFLRVLRIFPMVLLIRSPHLLWGLHNLLHYYKLHPLIVKIHRPSTILREPFLWPSELAPT